MKSYNTDAALRRISAFSPTTEEGRLIRRHLGKTLCSSIGDIQKATSINPDVVAYHAEASGATLIQSSGRWALPANHHTKIQNSVVRTLGTMCGARGGISLPEFSEAMNRMLGIERLPNSLIASYLQEIYSTKIVSGTIVALPKEHVGSTNSHESTLIEILDKNDGLVMAHRLKRELVSRGFPATFIQCKLSALGFARHYGDNLYGFVGANPDAAIRNEAIKAFNAEALPTPTWSLQDGQLRVEILLGLDYAAGRIVSTPPIHIEKMHGTWKTDTGETFKIDKKGIRNIRNLMKSITDERTIRLTFEHTKKSVIIDEINSRTVAPHQFVRTPSEIGRRLRQAIVKCTAKPITRGELRKTVLDTFENSLISKNNDIRKHFEKHLNKMVENEIIYRFQENGNSYLHAA